MAANEQTGGLQRALTQTGSIIALGLPFLNTAVAIVIMGLAVDQVQWGASDHEIMNFEFVNWNNTDEQYHRYGTSTFALPQLYDVESFTAMLVAAVVAIVGGVVVAGLSVVHWRSVARPASNLSICTIRAIFGAMVFAVAVAILIHDRELFQRGHWDYWNHINPNHFKPSPAPRFPQDQDKVVRIYDSPQRFNPITWNCRYHALTFQSGLLDRMEQLCHESRAARDMLAALVALQGLTLIMHTWAWWVGTKSVGELSWTEEGLESEERLPQLPKAYN